MKRNVAMVCSFQYLDVSKREVAESLPLRGALASGPSPSPLYKKGSSFSVTIQSIKFIGSMGLSEVADTRRNHH